MMPPGRAEAQTVGDERQREHDHLERHDHGEHAQVVDGLGEAVLHARDVPGAHGGADQDDRDRAHRDEDGPADGIEEPVLVDRRLVVLEPDVGLLGGQLEGLEVDEHLVLERVEQHHHDGQQPHDAEKRHEARTSPVEGAALLLGRHHCCTSLERVARSWMSPMATTIRQKMTAFAWPTPSQPTRP